MKTNLLRTVLIAAAAVTTAASAYAQHHYQVKIPFAFKAQGAIPPAGDYVIAPSRYGAHTFTLTNRELRETYNLLGTVAKYDSS